jgi:hypothetical protein
MQGGIRGLSQRGFTVPNRSGVNYRWVGFVSLNQLEEVRVLHLGDPLHVTAQNKMLAVRKQIQVMQLVQSKGSFQDSAFKRFIPGLCSLLRMSDAFKSSPPLQERPGFVP